MTLLIDKLFLHITYAAKNKNGGYFLIYLKIHCFRTSKTQQLGVKLRGSFNVSKPETIYLVVEKVA